MLLARAAVTAPLSCASAISSTGRASSSMNANSRATRCVFKFSTTAPRYAAAKCITMTSAPLKHMTPKQSPADTPRAWSIEARALTRRPSWAYVHTAPVASSTTATVAACVLSAAWRKVKASPCAGAGSARAGEPRENRVAILTASATCATGKVDAVPAAAMTRSAAVQPLTRRAAVASLNSEESTTRLPATVLCPSASRCSPTPSHSSKAAWVNGSAAKLASVPPCGMVMKEKHWVYSALPAPAKRVPPGHTLLTKSSIGTSGDA